MGGSHARQRQGTDDGSETSRTPGVLFGGWEPGESGSRCPKWHLPWPTRASNGCVSCSTAGPIRRREQAYPGVIVRPSSLDVLTTDAPPESGKAQCRRCGRYCRSKTRSYHHPGAGEDSWSEPSYHHHYRRRRRRRRHFGRKAPNWGGSLLLCCSGCALKLKLGSSGSRLPERLATRIRTHNPQPRGA